MIHEIPDLSQHRGGQATAGPQVAHHQVQHALTGWRPFLGSVRTAEIASAPWDEQALVRRPDTFIALAFFLRDLLPPSLSIALVMLVRVLVKEPVSSVGICIIDLRHAAQCLRHALGRTGCS